MTTQDETARFRSAEELADLLGVHPDSVKRLARQERLNHVRVGTKPLPGRRDVRRVMFTPEQVQEAVAAWTEVVPTKGESECVS